MLAGDVRPRSVEQSCRCSAQNCQKLADFTLQQSLVLMTALTLLDFGRESTVTDETLKLVSSSAWP